MFSRILSLLHRRDLLMKLQHNQRDEKIFIRIIYHEWSSGNCVMAKLLTWLQIQLAGTLDFYSEIDVKLNTHTWEIIFIQDMLTYFV